MHKLASDVVLPSLYFSASDFTECQYRIFAIPTTLPGDAAKTAKTVRARKEMKTGYSWVCPRKASAAWDLIFALNKKE
jgi:hypothetical protein